MGDELNLAIIFGSKFVTLEDNKVRIDIPGKEGTEQWTVPKEWLKPAETGLYLKIPNDFKSNDIFVEKSNGEKSFVQDSKLLSQSLYKIGVTKSGYNGIAEENGYEAYKKIMTLKNQSLDNKNEVDKSTFVSAKAEAKKQDKLIKEEPKKLSLKERFTAFKNRVNEILDYGIKSITGNKKSEQLYHKYMAPLLTVSCAGISAVTIGTPAMVAAGAIYGYVGAKYIAPYVASVGKNLMKSWKANDIVTDFVKHNPNFKEKEKNLKELHFKLIRDNIYSNGLESTMELLPNKKFYGKTIEGLTQFAEATNVYKGTEESFAKAKDVAEDFGIKFQLGKILHEHLNIDKNQIKPTSLSVNENVEKNNVKDDLKNIHQAELKEEFKNMQKNFGKMRTSSSLKLSNVKELPQELKR